MSVLTYSAFPRLKSASKQDVHEGLKEYKSGASFIGVIEDNRKIGKGLFVWPNGAKYEGDFMDNERCGRGIQVWNDRSEYTGHFLNDLRHGQGKHKWINEETYEGYFYKDRRHGSGCYTWADDSTYTGTFYLDKKEGYGMFKFANGDVFEGLYKNDEREGPGVLTYPDKSQDVGLWHGEKLIKLCSNIAGAFTMKNHQEFDYKSEEYAKEIDPMEKTETEDIFAPIIDPPEQFRYMSESKIASETESLYSEHLDQRSVGMKMRTFEEEFFKDVNKNILNEKGKMIKAWNNTPTCIVMQKHIYRHRHRQNTAKFDVQCLLKGSRGKHDSAKKGLLEKASEKLIQASMKGDIHTVEDLLAERKVAVDVSDKHGHTALLGAAVNWHQDIINCLLDNGADVNKLNDEGISALAACHVFFYPIDSFKYNIAEKHNEPVPDIKMSKPETKGILANKSSTSPLSMEMDKHNPKSGHGRALLSADSGFPQSQMTMRPLDEEGGKSRVIINEDAMSIASIADLIPESEASGEDLANLGSARDSTDERDEEMADYEEGQKSEKSREVQRSARSDEKSGEEDSILEDDNDLNENIHMDKTAASEFASNQSVTNLSIDVTDALIERCATQLSLNERVVSARSSHSVSSLDSARSLAIKISQHALMELTIRLLLKRGADPNASHVPMSVLFFAIKAADVDAVHLLLTKKADTNATLSIEKGGLAPLHIAVAIPGEEGVQITKLLLDALANPDVRAADDDSFLNTTLQDEWSKDQIAESHKKILGGRTPLHIVCARDDNYKYATQVVHLLLDHHANPNVLSNGHSPLSLAIASGNDMAIDELLEFGADPSLPLTHGIGSALCVALSTEYEHRRTPHGRIALVEKLIISGANILAPILIGPKRINGTAIDFAYYMFNLDKKIAHMPYHALTHAERDTYNARRKLLAHAGEILRHKVIEREKVRLEEEEISGRRSASPSPGFVFVGAGAGLPSGVKKPKALKAKEAEDGGHVSFKEKPPADAPVRKPLFKYCYECGRSVGVRLSTCTRCKEVYYCSKSCKLKAWNSRHKDECIRISGRSPSPGLKGRESPTPATNADKHGKTTVKALNTDKNALRIKVTHHGLSKSAKCSRGVGQQQNIEGRPVKTAGVIGRTPEKIFYDHTRPYKDNYSFV